jgi:hypothetical protein
LLQVVDQRGEKNKKKEIKFLLQDVSRLSGRHAFETMCVFNVVIHGEGKLITRNKQFACLFDAYGHLLSLHSHVGSDASASSSHPLKQK